MDAYYVIKEARLISLNNYGYEVGEFGVKSITLVGDNVMVIFDNKYMTIPAKLAILTYERVSKEEYDNAEEVRHVVLMAKWYNA